MNKVILSGNLTRDPETRTTENGVSVCHFTVAVRRDYSEDVTDFFNCTAWRTTAENCGKYLKKGSKVALVGSLQNRSFDDKDGNKRTVTEIQCDSVEFLSPKKEESDEIHGSKRREMTEIKEDDLPF